MTKFLKVLAATAALAAVVPFHGEGDDKGGTVEALLWKAKWTRDPDYQSDPEVNISFGFNNPFKKKNEEAELFADELVVDYCGDNTMTYSYCCDTPDVEYDNVDATTTEEPEKSCTCGDQNNDCGSDCTCGDQCTCTE